MIPSDSDNTTPAWVVDLYRRRVGFDRPPGEPPRVRGYKMPPSYKKPRTLGIYRVSKASTR